MPTDDDDEKEKEKKNEKETNGKAATADFMICVVFVNA